MSGSDRRVESAAADLVDAFGSGDLERYLGWFADDATFVFHSTPRVLRSRDEYRREWRRWQSEDGFRVISCQSTEQIVQHLGDAAVFIHRVLTRVRTNTGEHALRERETIVFRRQPDGEWIAVHEHLSPDPA